MSLLGLLQGQSRRTVVARRAVGALVVCASLAALAACSQGGSTSSEGSSSTSTGGVKEDTSLCNIVSTQDFFAAIGEPGGTLKASMQSNNGTTIVNCIYRPSATVNASSSINIEFTSDGTAAFVDVQKNEQGILGSQNPVSGLGDKAYWGTEAPLSPDYFELDVLKGNVIVFVAMDGSAADGSTYLNSAKQFAQAILPHV